MAATVTLSTTTLAASVEVPDRFVKVASTTGLYPGVRLYVDREMMAVIRIGVQNNVDVGRGVDGTATAPHSSSSTVTIGDPDQFYDYDPVGAPPSPILVSPWINVLTGDQWVAQGDELPGGAKRWWEKVVTTYGVGALGVRTETSSPS